MTKEYVKSVSGHITTFRKIAISVPRSLLVRQWTVLFTYQGGQDLKPVRCKHPFYLAIEYDTPW